MQAYLPIIQDLLFKWYQFTLDNAVYAAALAVSVWLLTALFYSIRIAFLNRSNRAKAKKAQNSVDAAQQQTQKLQEELTANTTRMEESEIVANTATQRALDLERRITERNKQLTDSLQALRISFNLDRQALPAEGDLEADGLWQQYSAAIAQLTERLGAEQQTNAELQQAYQSETAKLAQKETLLRTLQAQLDTQAQLEAQNALLQQQISDSAQKQQANLTRLAELEQLATEWTQTKTQQLQLEEKIHAQNILIMQLEQTRQAEQSQPSVIEQQQPAPVELEAAVAETLVKSVDIEQPSLAPVEDHSDNATGKLKHMFDSAVQQITKLDKKLSGETTTADKTTEQYRPVLTGKLKHMFGSVTQQIAKLDEKPAEETTTADKTAEEPQPALMEDDTRYISTGHQSSDAVKEHADSVTGKIRNLFGTRKSPTMEPQATKAKREEQEIPSTPEAAQQLFDSEANGTDGTSKKIPTQLKNLFRKFQPRA